MDALRPVALALLLATVSVASADAQTGSRPRPGPGQRYAVAITRQADSVVIVAEASNAAVTMVAADASDTSIAKLSRLLSIAGTRMQTLAGDFDATVPPEGFERLHAQLVDPLTRAATSYFEAGSGLASYGESSPQARLRLLQNAMARIQVTILAVRDYTIARDRAKRLLAQEGIDLPTMTHFGGASDGSSPAQPQGPVGGSREPAVREQPRTSPKGD